MKRNLGLIASGLILSCSLVLATDNLDEAFKSGTVSGSLETYGIHTKKSGTNLDEGMLTGTVGLGFETASYNGFTGKVAFLGAHVFAENHNGAADVESSAMLTEANIRYETNNSMFKVGRQELNLEWLQDYHEAFIAETSALENTSILVGFSNRMAFADADKFSDGFQRINNTKGIYVVDAIYTGIADFELNPYYYNAPDLSQLYGMKARYYMDNVEFEAQYAISNEKANSGFEDGSIFHLKADAEVLGAAVSLGYVRTNKDGSGSIIDLGLGDNINPFEDGNYVYDLDARTIYASATYGIGDISLTALYGETKYEDNKEKELNLSSEIEIIDDVLEVGLLFVNVDAQDSNDDYQKYIIEVEYSF